MTHWQCPQTPRCHWCRGAIHKPVCGGVWGVVAPTPRCQWCRGAIYKPVWGVWGVCPKNPVYHILNIPRTQLIHLDRNLQSQPIHPFLQINVTERLQAIQALNERITMDKEAFRCLRKVAR